MKKILAVAVLGLSVAFCGSVKADERAWPWSPLGIGIAAPIQLPFMSSDIYGLRAGGFFGYNHDVYGLDCGLVELSSGKFAGVQAAALTWTVGDVYGIQIGALGNMVNERMLALQIGAVNTVWNDAGGIQIGIVNYDAALSGVQVGGLLNWNTSASCGFEIATINVDEDEIIGCSVAGLLNNAAKLTGFALAPINVAYEATGLQLGVINACDRMHGVQIGLINMIAESKLPIMVLANASF